MIWGNVALDILQSKLSVVFFMHGFEVVHFVLVCIATLDMDLSYVNGV